MVKVYIHFLIKIVFGVIGNKINFMVMGFMYMLLDKDIKANLLMGKNMGKEFTIIVVELFLMDNGIKIENMDLVLLFILIIKDIKGIG